MLKKIIALGSIVAVLSFVVVLPVSAQTEEVRCGFWANLFGRCEKTDQSAAVMNARLGSTTKDTKSMKQASTTAATAAQIQCVGSAIASREASLVAGMSTYTTSLNSAYSTRASELASAYSKTTHAELRAGISTAWKNFNASTKNAQKAWRTAKENAWNAFKTAVKACKATDAVTDSANVVTEMSGE